MRSLLLSFLFWSELYWLNAEEHVETRLGFWATVAAAWVEDLIEVWVTFLLTKPSFPSLCIEILHKEYFIPFTVFQVSTLKNSWSKSNLADCWLIIFYVHLYLNRKYSWFKLALQFYSLQLCLDSTRVDWCSYTIKALILKTLGD